MKNILVTTAKRGAWFAQVEESANLSTTTLTDLKGARMAIKFGTTKGIHQLDL